MNFWRDVSLINYPHESGVDLENPELPPFDIVLLFWCVQIDDVYIVVIKIFCSRYC